MSLRVWTTTKLYAPYEFTEIKNCNVRHLRFEGKGLGAAQIDVDLSNYSEAVKQSFLNGNSTPAESVDATTVGTYIFIQRDDLIEQPPEGNTDTTIDPASSDYKLKKPSDPSVFWFGYISGRSFEVQALSNDIKGTLDCLQIGHAVNKFKIRLPKECANGFNPLLDGVYLGNKKGTTFAKAPADFGKDPLADIDKYWSVKEVVDFLVIYGTPFAITSDWSRIIFEDNNWLNQYETIPSYEGSDLTSSLEDILDVLSWVYEFNEDDELLISFVDPVGGMTDSYIYTFYVPANAKEFRITAEEQSFEQVRLRGDRVIVAGSLSTYGGKDTLKLNRTWINSDASIFANPLATSYNILNYAASIDTTLAEQLIDANPYLSAEEKEKQKSEAANVEMKKQCNKAKAARELTPDVYQHFKFPMCILSSPVSAGDCLPTHSMPGNWKAEQTIAGGNYDSIIPFFPHIQWQTDEIDTSKPIEETILGTPVINDKIHETPIASEWIFEDTVPWKPYDKSSEWFNKPRFYYRTFGQATQFGDQVLYDEAWQYGDMVGDGLMSSDFTFDFEGIKLKSPQPESFAWNDDCLFQQGATAPDEYSTSMQDFGVQRTEWENDTAFSDYDPVRVPYLHKGHWSRLIFSFAARSNQRMELKYGNLTSTDKIKFEDDDSLQCWIIRKGFVPYLSKDEGIGGDGVAVPGAILPYYQTTDDIVRNDIDKAKERLTTLWNFWNKPKRAVQITLPVYDATGNMYDAGTTVGSFLDKVTDGLSNNTEWVANSFVSSIEFNFDTSSPSIIISTEYPSSPRRTREKRLQSSWKYKRFGRAPTNKAVK